MSLTFDGFISKLNGVKTSIDDIVLIALESSFDELQDEYTERIFDEGKSTDGTLIGTNKNDSYSENTFTWKNPTISPVGKGFKKNKDGSLRVFGGYKHLREELNLPVDKIYLEFSGELRRSFDTDYGNGMNAFMLYCDDQKDLIPKQETYYGKMIFDVTNQEEDTLNTNIISIIDRQLDLII